MSEGPRILVCDGARSSVRALGAVLRDAGFTVDVAVTAQAALDRAALRVPDAVILEPVLPDADGIEVCRRVREWSAIPLVVVSAVDEEERKVRALEAGADDYVTKPFAPHELVARLRRLLRRTHNCDSQPRVIVDDLEIDLAARAVRRDGRDLHLTPIEFKLLRTLVRHRGRLLTHETLLSQVWGNAYAQDTGLLRTHMSNLRAKIDPSPRPGHIHTVHGVGYRFAAADQTSPLVAAA